ncbi:MAG: tetratricopeptide repeat protein [Acidobacteria bacterium]|nr:MAG: tetratricopeptide repeat protein [Acidobacteriota bacterium]
MKIRLTGGVTLLLLIAALVTVPLAAADAKLLVNCVKESGEPIPDLIVYVHDIKTDKVTQQKTNKKGVAEVKKLPEGVYRVWARTEGFDPILVEFFPLKGGEQKTLDLKFKPGDANRKYYFEDPAANQQVDQLFTEAVGLLQKNQLEPAIDKLKQALVINPTSPGARQNLALAYANQQKWDLAEQEVKQAIADTRALKLTAPPENAKAYDDMEAALQKFLVSVPAMKIQLEADAALREGKNELAVTKLEELSKMAPDDPAMLYNLALAQAKLRRFEDAKKTIEKAATLNPQDKNIQDLKRLLGENEKALILQQLQQTLAAGDEAMKQGKYDEALAKYQQVQAEAPPEIQGGVWAGIARAYQKLNNEPQMLEAYQKAIAQGKNKTQYAQELAEYYFTKDKTQEGVQVLADVYKQGTDPLDQALFAAGAGYMKKNKKPQARALFEETLKANPEHAEAQYELGMIYFYDQKDPERAKAALTKYTQVGKDTAHLESAKAVLIVIEKTVKPAPAAKPAAPKKK